MVKYISEGEVYPRGYAIAYRAFDRNQLVCYPMPLHLLVRWWRDLICWLRYVGRPGYREHIERVAYQKGVALERAAHDRQEALIRQYEYQRGVVNGIAQEQREAMARLALYLQERRVRSEAP